MTNLEKLLSVVKKRHVYIQTHNYPDQDALASAFGLAALLKDKGIDSTICYSGQIDKLNTQKMVEIIPIPVYRGEGIPMTEEDEILLVDSQEGNINVKKLPGKIIACIDHHPKQKTESYRFADIRSDIGSCSAIIGDYFLENEIEPEEAVATALTYGIKMDTANLTRGVSETDIEIFHYLFNRVESEKLNELDGSSLRKEDLNAYKEAITNLKIYGRLGIVKIGDDYSEAILGSISDFLLTLSELDITVVYAYRVGGLKFSVRSQTPLVDAGKAIKSALRGVGDGGGHAVMAAGFIPELHGETVIADMSSLVEQRLILYVQKKLIDI
ncbi:DHH family phosphoesterase [Anaerocolumna xylanovorans]|uniref:DHHA1 domain-containing protein n=1 Tax=Anaerocolumna xylanovorans DSM 12503 TaxID=1121345 RepID=A0A1M7Y9J1_9FIRM|nr:DHH family phosphoesterase [Anaerocolumna xylanovorans]SHO49198.1 DHHA1 domain-containing protein [Anaerocolumna xylanovorans DSM 12503]